MENITIIAVNKPFPLFEKSKQSMKYKDGSVLEALGDGDGLWLSILLNKPTSKEIKNIKQRKITVRILEENGFLLPMIQFGSGNMIFEMSFDPTKYKDDRIFEIGEVNNRMSIFLIDSSTFMVKAIRNANLPLKFIQSCLENWSKALLDIDFSEKYKEWYTSLQSQSIERLWLKSEYVGKMGDVYNAEEVKFNRKSNFYEE